MCLVNNLRYHSLIPKQTVPVSSKANGGGHPTLSRSPFSFYWLQFSFDVLVAGAGHLTCLTRKAREKEARLGTHPQCQAKQEGRITHWQTWKAKSSRKKSLQGAWLQH